MAELQKVDFDPFGETSRSLVKVSGDPFADAAEPQADEAIGPIVPGESISTITGQPVQPGEILPPTREITGGTEKFVRPALEMGGMLAGGAAGFPAGPGGSVAGGGLGYAAGKKAADIIYTEPGTVAEELIGTGTDVLKGAAMEAGGQVLGKALPWAFGKAGDALKAVHGRLTGVGKAGTEAAIESGKRMGANPFQNYTDFDKALRGKISGDEVVVNARNALQSLKDDRGRQYVEQLEKIKIDPTLLGMVKKEIVGKVKSLMGKNKFDIKANIDEAGGISFDFSNSTLVESQPVINKALKDLATWGDDTAAGLDTLKKRISTYANQVKRGTPQESFLMQIERSLSKELKNAVPGYANMTKGYAEATQIIKDIESGLMMRKQGMSGRIVADQTLRRLISSMKDNFSLRQDLVKALSVTGGDDISGQIAGATMQSYVPTGLSGSGPALLGNVALAQFVSPAFWPVLASSSPKMSAEFLRIFGKGLSVVEGTAPTIAKQAIYQSNAQ